MKWIKRIVIEIAKEEINNIKEEYRCELRKEVDKYIRRMDSNDRDLVRLENKIDEIQEERFLDNIVDRIKSKQLKD